MRTDLKRKNNRFGREVAVTGVTLLSQTQTHRRHPRRSCPTWNLQSLSAGSIVPRFHEVRSLLGHSPRPLKSSRAVSTCLHLPPVPRSCCRKHPTTAQTAPKKFHFLFSRSRSSVLRLRGRSCLARSSSDSCQGHGIPTAVLHPHLHARGSRQCLRLRHAVEPQAGGREVDFDRGQQRGF